MSDSFSPFGIDDPSVAARLEQAESARDDLILKLARLTQQQPDGFEKLLAMRARQVRLDSRDGLSVWREVRCEKCGKSMLYNNGDERDLTCGDVMAIKCWNCGATKTLDDEYDGEFVDETYPRPDVF